MEGAGQGGQDFHDPHDRKRLHAEQVLLPGTGQIRASHADGGEFGLGAEIGISTQKLHVRGPFALEALTTYKYIIEGEGQVRA